MLSNGRWRGIFSARSILSSLPQRPSSSNRASLAFTPSHWCLCFSVRRSESSRTFTHLEIWPSRKRPCSQPHDASHPATRLSILRRSVQVSSAMGEYRHSAPNGLDHVLRNLRLDKFSAINRSSRNDRTVRIDNRGCAAESNSAICPDSIRRMRYWFSIARASAGNPLIHSWGRRFAIRRIFYR
jgi:hypothetical protein